MWVAMVWWDFDTPGWWFTPAWWNGGEDKEGHLDEAFWPGNPPPGLWSL